MQTPCGEEAWVLVTEYIEGTVLSDLLESHIDDEYQVSGDPSNSTHFDGVTAEELGAIVSFDLSLTSQRLANLKPNSLSAQLQGLRKYIL